MEQLCEVRSCGPATESRVPDRRRLREKKGKRREDTLKSERSNLRGRLALLHGCNFDSDSGHEDKEPGDPNISDEGVDEMDRGKSPTQLAMEAKKMAAEKADFARYIRIWKSSWGFEGYGSFRDMTAVSSMHFTNSIPGSDPSDRGTVAPTLQVFSIKISEIKGGLRWPLSVYGVVAARDAVDHNRNLLFARGRSVYQTIKEDDPYLRLTGPSRAIVFEDPVEFEIQLKLRGSTAARDRALITSAERYSTGIGTVCFENCFCTTELKLEVIERSVQATILGVCVKGGPWPSKYGGRVVCYAPSRSGEINGEVVLSDSCSGGMMPTGLSGHLRLSRNVVSVEVQGSLQVSLQAYSSSGGFSQRKVVSFKAKSCLISQASVTFGGAKVEITVAWSRLVSEKEDITTKGWVHGLGDSDKV